MKRFVAIAPILFLESMSSEFLKKQYNEPRSKEMLEENMGCEVFTYASGNQFVREALMEDPDLKFTAVEEIFCDSNIDLINKKARANYAGFFPAGTSL